MEVIMPLITIDLADQDHLRAKAAAALACISLRDWCARVAARAARDELDLSPDAEGALVRVEEEEEPQPEPWTMVEEIDGAPR